MGQPVPCWPKISAGHEPMGGHAKHSCGLIDSNTRSTRLPYDGRALFIGANGIRRFIHRERRRLHWKLGQDPLILDPKYPTTRQQP